MKFAYRKFLLLCFLLSLSVQMSFAQGTSFQIDYDVYIGDIFGSIRQTSDNGYILTGTSTDIFNGHPVLIKLDSAGTMVWSKGYGLGFFQFWSANDVQQTGDGGYIMTGSHNGDVLLIKTDASGVQQWAREYGGSDDDQGYMVQQTSDGGYIVSGLTYSFSAKDSSNFYLLKMNSSGILQWDMAYEISTVDDEPAVSVVEMPDGYAIVGSTPQIFGVDTTRDAVIIKTNSIGNVMWAKTYGADNESEEFTDIKMMSSGEFIVTGYTEGDALLLKVDTATGAVNFSSEYTIGFDDVPGSVEETSDGGMAMIGFSLTNLLPATIKTFLLKTNSTGTIQLSNQYQAGFANLIGRGEQCSDGGYILGGLLGIPGNFNYGIYKTDNTGSIGCNDTNVVAVQSAYAPAVTTPTLTLFSGGSDGSTSPTDGTLTVTDNVGCLFSACSPPPAPTLSTTDTDVCVSETGVTYTTQSGYDTYTWTVVGGTIASGAGTNSITVDWGTGPTGTVNLVIDSSGCAGNLSTENVSIADPSPTLSTTSTSVCEGQTSVTYTTQAGFSTYTWTVSGGAIASGSGTNSITVDWATSGAGNVDLTVLDAFGCTGSLSSTENVTINANPTPTLSVSDTVVCDGETGVTYTTQAGFSTYTWTIGGGSIASGGGTNSITVDWGVSGGGTVDLTVVDASGCSGSLSATQTITINPNPTPTLTTTSTSVCDGQVGVVFTTESFYSSYSWTVGGGSITSGTGTDSINVDWGSPGGGTVDLTVTDTNGCSGSLASTESVTINASPSPTLTVTDTLVCENEPVTYTTQTGFTTYTWTVTGGTIASGQGTNSITIDWGVAGGGTVSLTVDSNGCSGSLSSTETVTILSAPTANITPSGTVNFCTGDSIQLVSDSATTYLWLLGGVSTGLTTQSVYLTTDGDYQVVVTNAAGCPDTSAITTVVKNPSPIANISASGSLEFCGGDSVILTADSASIYLWLFNGVSTGQTTPSITVTDAGDYQVAISNAFCQDTSTIVTVTVSLGTVLTTTGTVVDSSNCGSSDGSITGTIAGGTPPFTYEWTNSSSVVVGGNAADLINVPADTYTLTITDSTLCTATAVFTIFDIGAPAAPVAGPDAMYCQGDTIADLTAVGSGGTLTWYSDPFLLTQIGIGSPFSSGATSSSVFYVTETVAGCESTADIVSIVINPTPATPVAGTDSTYCSGNPIADLTATGGGGTFTWYSDSLLTDSIGNGSPFTSGAITTDTFYVTETASGCESAYDAVFITIISTPVGLITSGNASYCLGEAVADLTATGAGGVITWYSNTALTDTVFTGSPFVSGATTDTTFYVTETSNGCASATDSLIITFTPQPPVVLTASTDTICPGGDVTLTASGADSYLWNTGDTGAVIVVNPTSLTSYTVTGTTGGCQSLPISVAVVTDSSLSPTITIDAGPNVSICEGSSITLTASGADSYIWSTGDTTASITVSPLVNTVYSVVGTSLSGCITATAFTSISISAGGVIAGFSANPISGNIPLNVSFTDTSVGAVAWQWDFSYDSLLFNDESSLENPDYTFTSGGTFQVLLIASDASGCTDTASLTLTLNVTEEVFIPNLFTPNGDGRNDIMYVRGNGIDNLHLAIYDRWGEKVYEGEYAQIWALEDTYPSGIGWDGTYNDQPMNPAVFVYVLTGSFISGEVIDQKGNITLVR